MNLNEPLIMATTQHNGSWNDRKRIYLLFRICIQRPTVGGFHVYSSRWTDPPRLEPGGDFVSFCLLFVFLSDCVGLSHVIHAMFHGHPLFLHFSDGHLCFSNHCPDPSVVLVDFNLHPSHIPFYRIFHHGGNADTEPLYCHICLDVLFASYFLFFWLY